jgi:DMSO/TMAO reductase YedYZ molybdopterin-dependent catalytic subunit
MSSQRGVLGRWIVGFNAGEGPVKRATLKLFYYVFIILPYPLRRLATAGFIVVALAVKKVAGVEKQNELTPLDEVGTLSFWGVPAVDVGTFTLTIDGEVDHPLVLPYNEVLALPAAEREVRMDCVGGFRNNTVMKGVLLAHLLEVAEVRGSARQAVFHCVDGYYESISLADLRQRQAFLGYSVNGEQVAKLGYPLRLAIPGKYGYKWAKWVHRVELVSAEGKGYWESRGLPDRADVGDIW